MSKNKQGLPAQRSAGTMLAAGVTLVLLVACLAALLVVRPLPAWVDRAAQSSSALEQTVSQRMVETYCPARMSLADTSQYGDSEFQVSQGDVASSSRYSAFGAIYRSTVSTLSGENSNDLKDSDPTDESAVHVMVGNADQGSLLQQTQLLEASQGTGVASATASWASQGDLRGLAATSCADSSLTHAFLLPGTQTGWSQQIVVANSSSQATSVSVQVWGTSQTGGLTLATSGSLTVNADGETVYDLSAAAANQDGLYVTLTSQRTPVHALVRVVAMNGLTAQGSDYVAETSEASQMIAIAGVKGVSSARVLLFADQNTSVSLSWITPNGLVAATSHDVTASQVGVVDLGAPPADAVGVGVTADQPVRASVVVTRNGDGGQSDFAVLSSGEQSVYSAAAVPDQVEASLAVSNVTRADTSVTFDGYDADGRHVGAKDVTLGANCAQTISLSDLGDNVAVVRLHDERQTVSWNVMLQRQSLADAGVGAVAAIGSTPLSVAHATIYANPRQGVVK